MAQHDTAQQTSAQESRTGFGARDLIARLYREIGISAVAAALQSNREPTRKVEDPSRNPAVMREEKAA
ncbi:hypothetical protein [Methylocella sp.]|uniref:hypothetical protein n=1 Tax=Methylocella sp. TaxID=1978226 RepID=UPI0037832A19